MTKTYNNYEDLITFTRASGGHALRPVSYGTELVTNGDFATDSDWTLSTNVSISSGKLNFNATNTNFIGANQSVSFVIGKVYQISIDVDSVTSGEWQVFVARTSGDKIVIDGTSTGSFSGTYVSDGTETNFYVARKGATTLVAVLDNVSVKEVTFDQPDGTLTLFEHPDNVPRVEYDADGNRLGLLVEEARTNLIPYSQDFEDSSWAGYWQKPTFTTGQLAPDGTYTAFKWNASETTGSVTGTRGGLVYGQNLGTTGIDYTASVWMKASGSTSVLFGLDDGVNTEIFLTSKWVRYVFTGQTGASKRLFQIIEQTNDDVDIYIWGAQTEQASFATSYIKTTGSTATRSADVASIPVADFGYNNKEITVMAEFIAPNWASSSTYHRVLSFDGKWGVFNDGNLANGTVRYRFDNDSGVAQFGAGNLLASTYGTSENMSKVAFALKNNDAAITKDGNAVGTDTSGDYDIELRTTLIIGAENASTNHMNGHLKNLKIYPRRLTNAQLQEITS